MTAPQLLEGMRARGFVVSVKEGRLSVVPASQLTEKIRGALKQHKNELLELLAQVPPRATPIEEKSHELGETPLEFLRMLRNAGVSVQVEEIDGEPFLASEFPKDSPKEWERACVARITADGEAIAKRLKFERWHWSACVDYFNLDGEQVEKAPIGLPYRDWAQFARFQTGAQTADDLKDLARFVVDARHKAASAGAVFHYGHIKIVWRVVAALADREPSTGDLLKWAELVAGGEAS